MSHATVLAEVRAAVSKRKGEGSQLTAIATVLARHGYAKNPVISSSRYGETGSTVRVYRYRGSPAGDIVLITGPGIEAEVHTMDDLAKQKAPKGFYVELGAGSPREEARVASALERAQRAAKDARSRASGGSSRDRKPQRETERSRAWREAHKASPPAPPPAPRMKYTAGRGGRAPYLPGVETAYAPRMTYRMGQGGQAPYLPGVETVRHPRSGERWLRPGLSGPPRKGKGAFRGGRTPEAWPAEAPPRGGSGPAPGSDEYHMAKIQAALAGVMAQFGLSAA